VITTPAPARWIAHAVVVSLGLAAIIAAAPSPATQTPASQKPAAGTPPLFTGSSTAMESKDLSVARRRFEPGARSYWHSHDNGQLLLVEEGRMWAQKRGQAKRDFGPGESDYTGPNVVHWHGAAATTHLIQVNVGFGGGARWLEAVTDADYRQ
jgi:quercetin dioxygenase-like cupin family protein